jgi:hypothetical protein
MKTYIGTKMISAEPMSRAAYNEYRNWDLPENEDGADEGYLVEYLDGGQANDSRHAGYISWSPKAQFEAAYLCIGDVSGLPAHQQRVVAEKVQLDDTRDKLHAFKQSDKFHTLCDKDERSRMIDQVIAMDAYSEALGLRIRAFKQ